MVLERFNLDGKIAAVTGPTRGLGYSIATALAEAGADVALLQRTPKQLHVQDEIQRCGRQATIIPCDLERRDDVNNAIDAVISQFGKIDILVNNAGIQRRASAVNFSERDWDDVIAVNLKAVWTLSQCAGKYMLQQGGGKIINIASLMSFQGGIRVPAYAAAKGAVAQLTKALANEWAQYGVNVNAIVPGYISTDMNKNLLEDTERYQQITERIPAGRWGTPDDFKGAAIYLASSASDYVHGHLLTVDGGWMGR